MKKNFFALLLCLFIWGSVNAEEIEKRYYFRNHSIENKGDYQLIHMDNLQQNAKIGEPILPYQSIQLLIAPGEIATKIEFFF